MFSVKRVILVSGHACVVSSDAGGKTEPHDCPYVVRNYWGARCCGLWPDNTLGVNGDGDPTRCPECIAAERSAMVA